MQHYINIIINSVFIENILLIYFLGMCSFLSISKKVETSIGLGLAVIFVLSITAPANWAINEYLLAEGALSWAGLGHINLDFLQFIVFISVIAAMVQLVEMLMDRFSPALYVNLGIFLPLITVNCSILGTSLFLVERDYNLAESTVFGFGSGLGFFLAIVSLATVRKRMRYSDVPSSLRGVGMAMLLTGLISMAFLGFSGISL
ncbi:NADH:ubiquinone reductase (Na(+)-transporting) subunit E [Candidatus Marinimicrobia bacterium]|jgi:Na+-transporting NADH:ubiquinone oxidoreductase subunit E|nr:NADH:ubiquinone reductase (Na(+)-transporting) subunit E [bacterium]MDA9935514.1 NADH:ubiquinone reductase (Na(+)-transporting) subunit E [Candidatus Neomarinimicrobiota bacterium]MBT4249124.1 NADH:ubiquinone reductase (Na(+)-transporting) subunit E [bacterium]MBT4927274.1 NADH:ubiquinone reductase (Na(+)-transporting) subunit E [bacterium]MBT5734414.1 NADH:ubiquinone reductase (Na(+)-transporting) subunit E [bacterium]|tara:strand:- start:497 stop:1105 length:609 start_codon:yes stop_codon:yes gene_type:complete